MGYDSRDTQLLARTHAGKASALHAQDMCVVAPSDAAEDWVLSHRELTNILFL